MTLLKTLFAALVALLARCGAPAQPYQVPPPADVFSVAAGTWDWSNAEGGACARNPHTISFSPDRAEMLLTYREPFAEGDSSRVVRYEVRGVMDGSSIRGFMAGETRRTPDGELVLWDLVLTGPDEYRWHRTDWAPGGYTAAIVRFP